MSNFNVWNKWGKLNAVMLGDTYKKEFFKEIKNKRIRDAFYRISDEAQEDLDNFENVLKQFGCDVIRPYMDKNDSIMNYVDVDGVLRNRKGLTVQGGIPRSPLQPRDAQITIGNKMYYTGFDTHGIWNSIECWNKGKDNIVKIFNDVEVPQVDAPSFTQIGRDLYIDLKENIHPSVYETIRNNTPGIRINNLTIGGHNDATFHAVKPGAILTVKDIQRYENTFPGWDVHFVKREPHMNSFLDFKHKTRGRWWIPGEEENDDLTDFVESWLTNWVGLAEETYFDVNALVLDEHHICVSSMNEGVIRFLEKHNMEAIHVPWRHRYFYDGGLHCITLDLNRDGTMTDYFPDRTGPITDEGFNE